MADADAVEAPTVNFEVGDSFITFEEFEVALENFKKNNFVEFNCRDSRTIEAARRRGTDRPLKAEFKYFELCFMQVRVTSPGAKALQAHRKYN